MMDGALAWQIFGQVAASLVAYGAVRADLKNMKERVATLEKLLLEHITKGA